MVVVVAVRKKMSERVKTEVQVEVRMTGRLQVQWAQGHQEAWKGMTMKVEVEIVA